jgi:putative flippase GtrA
MVLRNHTFLKYCLIGVINTVSCFSVVYVLLELCGAGYLLSNMAGYATGLLVSFVLNKYRNFRSSGHLGKEFFLFFLSFGVAYAANLAALVFAVECLRIDAFLSQILSGVFYTVIFYILMKHFVFQGNKGHVSNPLCRE